MTGLLIPIHLYTWAHKYVPGPYHQFRGQVGGDHVISLLNYLAGPSGPSRSLWAQGGANGPTKAVVLMHNRGLNSTLVSFSE